MKKLEKYMFDPHEYENFEEYEDFEVEAFLRGQAKGREIVAAEKAARELKMADFLRSHGVPEEIISEAFALK
jgi:hypothetical protein